MNLSSALSILVAIIVLFLCIIPVSGVVQEVTLKGSVTILNQPLSTLTIGNPQQYGCSYPAAVPGLFLLAHEYLGSNRDGAQ